MKALSIATLFAVSLAGTACSQTTDASADAPKTDAQVEKTAADVGGTFNLGLPEDTTTAAAPAAGGFNLDLPSTSSSTDTTDGFNLAAGVSASNGLAELPELDASIVDETVDDTLDALTEPVAADDEPVIRLD
ncbi:MAG: hypothetical protein AAFR51_01445 [Pseudomonadota bacterium]